VATSEIGVGDVLLIGVGLVVAINSIHDIVGGSSASAEQKPSDKTRRSKPARGAPPGTKPIDQSGKGRDWIHGTKDDVGAGPQDWVGVAPNGDIITTNPDGSAKNNGPSSH
jgi:hypothetical protein